MTAAKIIHLKTSNIFSHRYNYACNFATTALDNKMTTNRSKVTCKNCLKLIYNKRITNKSVATEQLTKNIEAINKIADKLIQNSAIVLPFQLEFYGNNIKRLCDEIKVCKKKIEQTNC